MENFLMVYGIITLIVFPVGLIGGIIDAHLRRVSRAKVFNSFASYLLFPQEIGYLLGYYLFEPFEKD